MKTLTAYGGTMGTGGLSCQKIDGGQDDGEATGIKQV
jgi:hypothetical protein